MTLRHWIYVDALNVLIVNKSHNAIEIDFVWKLMKNCWHWNSWFAIVSYIIVKFEQKDIHLCLWLLIFSSTFECFYIHISFFNVVVQLCNLVDEKLYSKVLHHVDWIHEVNERYFENAVWSIALFSNEMKISFLDKPNQLHSYYEHVHRKQNDLIFQLIEAKQILFL